jgi:acetylornithine/N-succinyldiaminopimelate aminotransferase
MADPTTPPALPALVQNYRRQDVHFVRGEGCYLYDDHGRRYLDAFAGVAVSALGHAHPALVTAIREQAGRLLHISNHYTVSEQDALAQRIISNAFPGQMLFCNSGTEANEVAYKTARLFGNIRHGGAKKRMLAFTNGFHGRTLGSLSITANPSYREPFAPLPEAQFLPYNDIAALTRAMGGDVAAVFIETIQGEGGLYTATTEFLVALRRLCDQHQALLVVDEVQTGIGRTGRAFGHQHAGITPDIITLAKGLGGGIPIGAALLRPEHAALLTPGTHGTTFGGSPFACAAAQAVLGVVFAPGFLAEVAARGAQLRAALVQQLPQLELRGQGLLLGLQLEQEPAALVKACLQQGLVVGPSGNRTLRLSPPLIITSAQIEEMVAALVRAVGSLQPATAGR